MLMVMFTMETGKTIKPMVMDSTTTLMEPDMKVTGTKINNMVKERRFGPIMLAMRASTKMERNMEEVSSYGPMVQLTLEISLRTIFTAWEFILGRTEGNMMVNGRTTRWTAKVYLPGLMEENMKDNMLTIRKKDKEYSRGQTDASTMVTGRTESNTAREFTTQAKARLKWESGPKGSVSTGLTTSNDRVKFVSIEARFMNFVFLSLSHLYASFKHQ